MTEEKKRKLRPDQLETTSTRSTRKLWSTQVDSAHSKLKLKQSFILNIYAYNLINLLIITCLGSGQKLSGGRAANSEIL